MDRFGLYAQYYDLLYKDKDYVSEAGYVHELIRGYHPSADKLLNLGCGTGKHDYALARLGYTITGVDLSEEMANQAINNIPADISSRLNFLTGDIRTLKLNTSFDAVISLFHVISYQVTNKDLHETIVTAHNYLEPGGLFIFDCWYGPGVMTDPPVVRIKRMSNDTINVTRLAEPVLHSFENTVDVNYTILINQVNSNEVTEIKETHKMRYLFATEIDLLIEHKFKVLGVNDWLTHKKPGLDSWNAVFILQKI
ncbi:MAG TPA: class I SAM-dependent methyltransferase [Mucilaginibacter sp.]|jgi:SAM-dependent methyltransferase|nr:class I SAM-dependent methyltransferase [Mucilaginibacter sp.]